VSEPLALRTAVQTVEMFLQQDDPNRKLSPGEIAMVERMVKAGITVEDVMKIVDRPVEGPEPDADATSRYEPQGNTAAKIPEIEGAE
jgi:hypothetical protein